LSLARLHRRSASVRDLVEICGSHYGIDRAGFGECDIGGLTGEAV
jgi:hypothetical protein